MAGPLGVVSVGPVTATAKVEEDVDGGTWPLLRGPDPIFCLDAYWFLQVSSQIAVITHVRFQSWVPSFAMTDGP
jgi:hypothetical protein